MGYDGIELAAKEGDLKFVGRDRAWGFESPPGTIRSIIYTVMFMAEVLRSFD
jgi:hypothetical protein